MQSVRAFGAISSVEPVLVGTPQGTKLGPILWLVYCNDLVVDGFSKVQYADDTTFYLPVFNHIEDNVAGAIEQASIWSHSNNMLLNSDKTTILNICFSSKLGTDQPVLFGTNALFPDKSAKFLGVTIDSKLSFNEHVSNILTKCNSRLYLMKLLRCMGLNTAGLLRFYLTNIRSLLTYAAPAWYTILSATDKANLERVQRTATKLILCEIDYTQRLSILNLPTLDEYISLLCADHFCKIAANTSHPLHQRIVFNNQRTSSRKPTLYRPHKCRTAKRQSSFFIHFMRHYNAST